MSVLAPPSTLPPGSIVDSYRRDSGGPKQDKSTAQQLQIIEEFCQQYGLVHRHRFLDQAESGGSTEKREDFERMISLYHQPAQRPQGLILWSYARFAREIENSIYYKAFIRTNKIIIHSLIDDIPEGDYGRIVEFFIDMSNEEKRKQAAKEAKRGLRELVLKYKCVPGVPPRGFERVPVNLGNRKDGTPHIAHRWEPQAKLTPRIRKAFQMLAAGATLRTIQKSTRLYNSINSYKTFFTNKIYIGILEFGDLVVDNYCKPLIDMHTWNRVQKRISGRAQTKERHPRRANSVYLLSGILKCGNCGAPLNGNTVTRRNKTAHDEAYRCSRAKRRADCTMGRIPRRALEKVILDKMLEYILSTPALSSLQEIALTHQTQGEQVRAERRAQLSIESAELSRQITNLAHAIAESGHSAMLLETLKQKEGQRAQIRAEQHQLEIPLQPIPAHTPPELAAASQTFSHQLNHAPPETLRQILHGILREITVTRTGNTVTGMIQYRYPFDYALTPQLPIESSPVGALLYRQLFSLPFTGQLKARS